MKRKGYSLLLMLLASVLVFAAACSSSDSDEFFDIAYDSGSGEKADLAGFEMVYKTKDNSTFCYEMETPIADDALAARDRVMKDLNCVITEIHRGDIREAIFGGVFLCDAALYANGIDCYNLAAAGMLTGLSDSSYIDYTNEEKWGTRNVLEPMFCETDLYGVLPCYWPEIGVCVTFPLLINENLIAKLGVDDPRQYYENKQWTWDMFESVLPLYYAEEGGNVVHYSFSSQQNIYAEHFIRSNGDRFAEKDSSGNIVLGFVDASTILAMSKAQELARNYKYAIFFHSNTIEACDIFTSDQAVLFAIHSSYTIGANGVISRNSENYGMIPWPVGPNVENDLVFSCGQAEPVLLIPVNTNDRDATEQILDALYEPMGGMTGLSDLKQYLAKNYFYDDRDMNVYYTMFQNCQYNYWSLDVRELTISYVSSADSAATIIDSKKDSFQASFERTVMPRIRGIISVWGDYDN